MDQSELQAFLDEKFDLYNRPSFIAEDPIQIPHLFSNPNDIEIAAFLTATLSWGRRSMIIAKARELMNNLHNQPFQFLMEADLDRLKKASEFQYRTFKQEDLYYFLVSLQNICKNYGSLSEFFKNSFKRKGTIFDTLMEFREVFFSTGSPGRTLKHIADVTKGAGAKRLNMFLRWMVRIDNRGVDFGIWSFIPPSELMLPLDIHTGTVARKLGLLTRNQDNWKAVSEITRNLRKFDPKDPVKYDFALFGLGLYEGF